MRMIRTQKKISMLTFLAVILIFCISLGMMTLTAEKPTAQAGTDDGINITGQLEKTTKIALGEKYVITINKTSNDMYGIVLKKEIFNNLEATYGLTTTFAETYMSGVVEYAELEFPIVITGTTKKTTTDLSNGKLTITAKVLLDNGNGSHYENGETSFSIDIGTIFDNGYGKTDCNFDTYEKGKSYDAIGGYCFKGWYLANSNTYEWLPSEAEAIDGEIYKAAWEYNGTYVCTDCLDLSQQTTDIEKAATEKWIWKADTKTLTLNGLILDTEERQGLILPGDSTIVLTEESENKIIVAKLAKTSDVSTNGVVVYGSLTIEGNGKLEVDNKTSNNPELVSCGIAVTGNITNKASEVTVKGGNGFKSTAISVIGDFVNVKGTLTATAGDSAGANPERSGFIGSIAIYAGGKFTVTDGNVTANGGMATNAKPYSSYGVYSKGAVTINGGSLTATSNKGFYSSGIRGVNQITQNAGKVSVTSGNSTLNASYAIWGATNVLGGELESVGEKYAINGGLITTGTVMAGEVAPGEKDETDYSTKTSISVKYVKISFEPIFDNSFGKDDCEFNSYTKGTKYDDIGYVFNGWFNNDTEITSVENAIPSTTYKAQWLNNGKIVVLESLYLQEMAGKDKLDTEGWKWDLDSKTLTLDNLTLIAPSDASVAIALPTGAKVVTSGENIVKNKNAESSWAFGIVVEGEITFKGTGSLNVEGANGIYVSVDGAQAGITIESGNIKATGTNASRGVGVYIVNESPDYGNYFHMVGGTLYAEGCNGIFLNANGGEIEVSITGGNITATGTDGAFCCLNMDLTDKLTLGENAKILTGTDFANPGYIAPSAVVTVEKANTADYDYATDTANAVKINLHTCVFDKEVATEKFLKTAATCDSAAVYYKSCECGEASKTETFTYGDKLAHVDENEDKKCDLCGADMPSGLSGGAIAGIIIGSVVIILAAAYVCGYFFLYKKGKLEGKALSVIYAFLKK